MHNIDNEKQELLEDNATTQDQTFAEDMASVIPDDHQLYSPYQVPQTVSNTVRVCAPSVNPKKKRKIGKWIAAAAITLAVVLVCCVVTGVLVSAYWNQRVESLDDKMTDQIRDLKKQIKDQTPDQIISGNEDTDPESTPVAEISTPGQVYADNVDAVVAISNESITTNIYGQVSRTASSGSGFIVSEDGYVVTNFHVIEGATTLRVITLDEEYEAELVGYDSTNDLAVLKIEEENLPYVTLGSSDALYVGDQVLAIGNPLGELTSTLTVGYISAKDRKVNTDGTYLNMLQTDAAINSGNSGGPLFNMNGQVIGITTAKYSGTTSSGTTIEGIGFAIPIDDVKDMIDSIIDKGYVTGAYLGVMVRDMDPEDVDAYGLPSGVYVDDVLSDSCAEAAGIKPKDIIVKIGENAITGMSDLSRVLRKYEAGDTALVVLYRDGTQMEVTVTFDEKPTQQQDQPTTEQEYSGFLPEDFFDFWFGGFLPGFN